MTVEEFRRLPEGGPVSFELRHGELVEATRPNFRHHRTQERFVESLQAASAGIGHVSWEVAFRALPQYELRVADVAWVTQERWDSVNPEDNLHGAPELVIEVLSPSNTAAEIFDKEQLCLEHGCLEFWVADADRRQVKVTTPDGHTITYRAGQEIPLLLFGSGTLSVDALFS
jgi:Uma2 family endonuclease